ncbi:AcrR family transcriptional regulator [Thermocatellispora tengchongensis]|uniref:AcrR family transcriptional regulator n=1 Tax=Thermocatellispora tengchongensis TaxID=1073253 RepID=A0A840P7I2_9ACTN|nr:TetR/AcrR family transcriptional regulator [Thermocatellispora tengchongensis]MBB5137304.1 AcrR family transcriptional regulator [Thermocatellispora tengchongensis]
MATQPRQSQRRRQVLSRERIVEAAIELLDTAGEGALTVRTLTERLSTGSGAIYHHVGTMNELLEAAIDSVIADALAALSTEPAAPVRGLGAAGTPEDEIRAVALGLFDAVTEHPWLAAQVAVQITRNPWGSVTRRVFESIGRPMRALGVPQRDWFATTSTLVHYFLGAIAQNAHTPHGTSDGRTPEGEAERAEFLDTAAGAWQDLDPDDYPFIRAIADQVREHDDREQFLTGINLVLRGIIASYPTRHEIAR